MPEQQMSTQPLLVELLTEELPPKALKKLEQAFCDGIHSVLQQHNLLTESCTVKGFSTPRRLAVLFDQVVKQAPDHEYTERLMPSRVGLDESGNMSAALQKRLEAKGLGHVTLQDLHTQSDGKQEYLAYNGIATGTLLADGLQEALDHTITHLPIPKVMRYQLSDGQDIRFVRPVHGLLAIWGDTVINVSAFGLTADRQTSGHRFMGQRHIRLPHASQYEELLSDQGQVIASFDQRRQLIEVELESTANKLGLSLGNNTEVQELLNEVNALVEKPSIYIGEFEPEFLQVPAECLILTMRLNQKYFPLFDPATGALTNKFLIVSNMQVEDPSNIIEGNQRVVRPRLADAQFFFDTDLKTTLSDRVEALKTSVYHNQLGTQFERTQRVSKIAAYLASQLQADQTLCERAAYLAKADLGSLMVGEFPELQGIMGAYYAQHDGEHEQVVQAIKQQYQLRVTQPVTTSTLVTTILFIAERIETMVGIWGIGLTPTGERDPFGLRRAALGIISAYEQLTAGGLLKISDSNSLNLGNLLEFAAAQFANNTIGANTVTSIQSYIYERYRNQLAQTYNRDVIDAVLAISPPIHQVLARVQACTGFASQTLASSLANANKRVSNILKRNNNNAVPLNPALLQEPAEQQLAASIKELTPKAQQCLEAGDFAGNLKLLASSKDAVDLFFDQVMIMADDEAIKNNRLALLLQLHNLMNQVADISRLE